MNIHAKSVATDASDAIGFLCSSVVETTIDDIPPAVRARIADHMMDAVGVGIAASGEPTGKLIADVFEGRETGSRLLGSGKRVEAWDAAWANGTLCHLLDFDDAGFTHPSACTVPAILAIGERERASGGELITAMAVAYETFARLIRSFRFYDGQLKKRGVHTMSVCGGLAAAAGAGKLLGLDQDQLQVAIGLAASSSFGVIEHFGTFGKPTHAGNAARAGAFSALLAEKGYQASRTAVLGHYGLFNALLGEGNYDLAKIGTSWGDSWAIETPGIGMKAFPLCNCSQRAARAVVGLRQGTPLDYRTIARIEVSATEGLLENLHIDIPQQGLEGKFSIKYAIAAGLVDGAIDIDTFSDDTLAKPDIQDLLQRIELTVLDGGYEDNEFRKATPIIIHMKDGSIIELDEKSPLGCLDNRMNHMQVVDKYIVCAGRVFDDTQVRRSIALFENIATTSAVELLDAVTMPNS